MCHIHLSIDLASGTITVLVSVGFYFIILPHFLAAKAAILDQYSFSKPTMSAGITSGTGPAGTRSG